MTRPTPSLEPQVESSAELILTLERAQDPQACGAKAANLGRMLRAGLPVPPGVVLTESARQAFIAHSRVPDRHADVIVAAPSQPGFTAGPAWPAALARALAQAIALLPGAGPLAVRSSAAGEDGGDASYAGMLDSVLHVDRVAGVEPALAQVWASIDSARALAYSRARARPLAAMGAIVQVQIDARIAGVLFTVSPESGHEQQMLCEYGAGLADKLVAGAVDPARIAIDRATLRAATPSAPATLAGVTLSAEALEALAVAALACERIFGGPQDIEWAIDATGKLWFVQSRPITAPARSLRRPVVWSNANVSENFPEPISPLLYSVAAQGYEHYFRNLGVAFGLAAKRLAAMDADFRSVIGVHAGRMYYNLSAIHSILRAMPFGARLVAWFDEFTGARDPRASSGDDAASFVRNARDALELVSICLHVGSRYLRINRQIEKFERRIDDYAARTAPDRLASLSMLDLRDRLRELMRIRLHGWRDAALADAAAMVCYGALKSLVSAVYPHRSDAGAINNALLQGLSGLKSAEPVGELWALARAVRESDELQALFARRSSAAIEIALASDSRYATFRQAFDGYLDRWGFRCSGELMLTVASFQERPGDLIEIIRTYAQADDATPEQKLAHQQSEREQATRRILGDARRQRLWPRFPWLSRARVLKPLLAATQAAIGLRERARLKQALLYSRLRRVALHIGERLAQQGRFTCREDVFYLTMPELDQLLSGLAMFPSETAALIAMRRAAHDRFASVLPADVLIGEEGTYPPLSAPAAAADDPIGDSLRGASVCGGRARGTAKVLADVSATRTLRAGDILVTRQTDPGWAPAFVSIGGLILERGGMLSHGAILAREYGIPTLVGVARATERIAHGATIEVDADHGNVRILA